MTLREWGRHLKRLRKPRYSNAGDFAAAVGVSKRTVENWEGGVHWPEATHMAQLVRVLGPEADPGAGGRLDRIEGKLDRVLLLLGGLYARAGSREITAADALEDAELRWLVEASEEGSGESA